MSKIGGPAEKPVSIEGVLKIGSEGSKSANNAIGFIWAIRKW
jgi:hypothetical protein